MKIFSHFKAKTIGCGLFLYLTCAVSAQNFDLTLEPGSVGLSANSNAPSSLVVYLSPLNGFTNSVALSAGTLPTGVTAKFTPQTMTPPGTSILTLTAGSNAAAGPFTLSVTAVGGGITNMTSSSVTVNFGLEPLCTGAFSGRVIDAQTSLPITNALVEDQEGYFYGRTDSNGFYVITNVSLGNNNAVIEYGLTASLQGYWASAITYAYAVCDATNTVNLQLIREEYGTISGTVTIQGGAPATNVPVTINGSSYVDTDNNGAFIFTNVMLAYTNAPTTVLIQSTGSGQYWLSSSNVVVRANSNSVVNLILTPFCYGTVAGSVYYGDTLMPATNGTVTLDNGQGQIQGAQVDASGHYSVTNVLLAENGTLATGIGASAPGYYGASANFSITNCGGSVVVPAIYLPAPPKNNFGNVAGHIYDVQTDLPIAGAAIAAYGPISGQTSFATTDSNGYYLCTNVVAGTGSVTNASIIVSVTASNYFGNSSNTVAHANTTVTQDVYLLKVGYGGVMGVLRDSATTLPITNAPILIQGTSGSYKTYHTDSNGFYFSGPIGLQQSNAPTFIAIQTELTNYYNVTTNTTITLGVTNTLNLSFLRICTGATIVGTVVNAQTQQPITNAYVVDSVCCSAATDKSGNFILTNIEVGNNNSPIQVTLSASAPGFNPESTTVTVFCGATVSVNFGAPQTASAIIGGVVTNVITGLPLAGVFIGSQFGESAMTDSNGFYQLTQAPLGANNSSRTWNITAIPPNFTAQTLPVTVSSNQVSTLNFGFGLPPTSLTVTATGQPNPVTVGNELVYLVTLTNTVADAQQVQLSDTLPPGVIFVSAALTNSPGTPFSAPQYSSNVVTTTASDFPSNSIVTLAITVTTTNAGTMTNVATVSSVTPDTNPAGTNRTATVLTTAVAPSAPPTELIVSLTATPPTPVPVGSNLLYSLILTNTIANAANVELVDKLPASVNFVSASVSNFPGATFGQPVFSQGTVTISAASFSSNSAVELFINVTPSVAGSLTNTVSVTSATTNLAAGSTLSAQVMTQANANADLALSLAENAYTNVLGSNVSYTIVVTNLGPVAAPDAVLDDTLPAGASYVSATTSQGTVTTNSGAVHWDFGAMANQGVATATLVVSPALGFLTNGATVTMVPNGAAVVDPNLSNNIASIIGMVVAPSGPPPTNLTIASIGAIAFNPQSGLYQQSIVFSNLSGTTVTAVRVSVLNLPGSVVLYNATGSTNSVPYVEYDQAVASPGGVTFQLEYFNATRQPFISTNFVVTAVAAASQTAPTGTILQVDRVVFLSQGQPTIEFTSIPGRTYVVEYSSDMQTWLPAAPPVVAQNTRTQWVDTGPPVTESAPGILGQRFYRVVQTN